MNKKIIFWVKIVIMLTVLGGVGFALWKSWKKLDETHIAVHWAWGAIAVAAFCCSMLTSGIVWRWLSRRMERRSGSTLTRGHSIPLIGAYTFSQLGKYFPGKVALVLMRIDRSKRFGMSAGICTLSTILENALYMISGALVGTIAIFKVASTPQMAPYRIFLWAATAGGMAALAVGCYPPVFYGLVNRLLVKMKKEPVDRSAWLGLGSLVTGVLGFVPCWIFGGIALWSSARAVDNVRLIESWWFAAAYALSVIIGMASVLPGGVGVRDVMLGVAAMLQFQQVGVAYDKAIVYGAAVAVLQRIFQIVAELIMGGLGATLTGRPGRGAIPTSSPQNSQLE
jgi:uncharacterized membrane protein YbhN (UPF0104 family)